MEMATKRRFIVSINQETQENVSSFLEYINQQGFGWWHWIDNFWLLVVLDTQTTIETLRDKLADITGGKTIMVLEIKSGSFEWANFGPNTEGGKNMSKWLKESWDTD